MKHAGPSISLELASRLCLVGAADERGYGAGRENHGEEGGGYEKVMHLGVSPVLWRAFLPS
jgi:hypothetical protein